MGCDESKMDRTWASFDVEAKTGILDDGCCACGSHRFDPVEIFAANDDMIVRCRGCGAVLAIPHAFPMAVMSRNEIAQKGPHEDETSRFREAD